MITITTKPGCELLLVELPPYARDPWLMETEFPRLGYYDPNRTFDGMTWSESIGIPPGSWEFIATTETITEEQAAELVACYIDNFYEDYTKKDTWDSFSNAIESLKSAITETGGDKETVYAILKKVEKP